MTDKEIIENQEEELHDEVTDEVVEAHDPKNAEAQSIAAVDKAGDATGSAPKRKGDNTKQDPMPKTKAGIIAAMVGKMQGMDKAGLSAMFKGESYVSNEDQLVEDQDQDQVQIEVDFKDDLKALVNEEATLSDAFKQKAETIFEAAINTKINVEIDRLEEKYNEELSEEVESTKQELVEKVDSYLNYVVEGWMEENKLAIQNGLRTEIAEDFMNKLKDLFTESHIQVPEDKVDIVDELADNVDELEAKLNESTEKSIHMAEELELYKRESIIREATKDLAETQVEKLKDLAENVDFDDEETFAQKVSQLKESYFAKTTKTQDEIVEDDDAPLVESTGSMDQYLKAIKKTATK
jgi:hypothetical protein